MTATAFFRFLLEVLCRLIVFVGRVFLFLSQAIDTLAVACGPPGRQHETEIDDVPIPELPFKKLEDVVKWEDVRVLKSECSRRQEHVVHHVVKSEDIRLVKSDYTGWQEHIQPSAPLDPSVELHIPRFACHLQCHRNWTKFYVVVIGRQPGIYNCWECTKLQVDGYRGQEHKAFPALIAAEEHFRVQRHCLKNHYKLCTMTE